MLVLVTKLDRSERMLVNEVERIEENEDLQIVLITPHSEPVIVDHYTQTIDIVGLGWWADPKGQIKRRPQRSTRTTPSSARRRASRTPSRNGTPRWIG